MQSRVLVSVLFTAVWLTVAADASAQSLRAQAEAMVDEAVRAAQGKDDPAESRSDQPSRGRRSAAGSIVMPALYGATIVVHGFDAHSTLEALDAGAREANPLLRPVARSRPGFIAFKGAVAGGIIYAGHHLAKRNKATAIVAMVAVNVLYSAIAAHNYRVAREMRAAQAR
jgi:hypothetical protein